MITQDSDICKRLVLSLIVTNKASSYVFVSVISSDAEQGDINKIITNIASQQWHVNIVRSNMHAYSFSSYQWLSMSGVVLQIDN